GGADSRRLDPGAEGGGRRDAARPPAGRGARGRCIGAERDMTRASGGVTLCCAVLAGVLACSGDDNHGGGGGPDGGGSFSFADAGTPAQNQACQTQLAQTWSRNPPAVGFGTQASQNAYLTAVGAAMAQYGVPGGAIAVTRHGQLVATQGIG